MITSPQVVYRTELGAMWLGDSIDLLDMIEDGSVNLVLTSPPFALTRQKAYGNQREDDYIAWFRKFADKVHSKLTEDGSFVIDLGGAWLPGSPTRSLYQYRLLLQLVDQGGYHLAEDFYWWNRSKLPGPREWVNIRRCRVKDAVNLVWWLSKSETPKASNLRVLRPYSESMKRLLARGTYNSGPRHSEHIIGENWAKDQGGAIPPNVLALQDGILEGYPPDNMLDIPNTASNDPYLKFCKRNGIVAHPARFPKAVPEFFVKFLTEPGDTVLDIFGGSNMTGHVSEVLGRRWITCERDADYARGSVGRFANAPVTVTNAGRAIGLTPKLWRMSPHPPQRS